MAQKHMDCDVIILGGGGAGLVAAARLGWETKLKVIVLEKRSKTGGGAQAAADFRVYGSRWQESRGIPDASREKLLEVMDETHWQLDPKLAWNTFKATGEFFDWFCDTRAGTEDMYTDGFYIFDGPDGPKIPSFKEGPRKAGNFVMKRLLDVCEEKGVEILKKTSVTDVCVENGKITSVKALSEDGEIDISCKACILATGSWIRNKEILEKTVPKFAKVSVGDGAHTHPSYTGDAISLAEKAGALIDWDSFCIRLMGPLAMVHSQTLMSMITETYPIQVNKDGKRWINEQTQKRKGIFETGNVLIDQPDHESFYLFDDSILEAAVGRYRSGHDYGWCFPAAPSYPEDYRDDIKKAQGAKRMMGGSQVFFMADTLAELAAQAGIDPEGLEKTVENYNRMCAEGCDHEFFKAPEDMLPLVKPPFYALRGEMGTDGAFGGVLVNESIQAYAENGGLVEGLYVPGDLSSGRFINVEGTKVQIINDLSWAFASGWISAHSAAEYIQNI